MTTHLRSMDLFSCIGCHALGFRRAGIETLAFCESNPHRRRVIARHFPWIPIYDDARTFNVADADLHADIIIGGPPCQRTSVAAAIHGRRTNESLWTEMFLIGRDLCVDWFVVEQPPGNPTWEAEICHDLSSINFRVAKFEFGACDIGAPYLRRRVFLVACTSLPRLEVARRALPSAIAGVKRAADARGDWSPDKLGTLRVDARSAGEMDRARSRGRIERIEALGDSNPPHMAEAIGRAIAAASEPTP